MNHGDDDFFLCRVTEREEQEGIGDVLPLTILGLDGVASSDVGRDTDGLQTAVLTLDVVDELVVGEVTLFAVVVGQVAIIGFGSLKTVGKTLQNAVVV